MLCCAARPPAACVTLTLPRRTAPAPSSPAPCAAFLPQLDAFEGRTDALLVGVVRRGAAAAAATARGAPRACPSAHPARTPLT